MIKAFPIYQHTSGCDYHRIRLPFIYSKNYIDHSFYNGFTVENCEDYFRKSDIIVYNRAFPLDNLKLLKKAGVKIVCDIDDYWILPKEHPLHNAYERGLSKVMIENIKEADLVTTTTERLAKKLFYYNNNVHVIPNALPFDEGQFIEGEKQNVFIYTGLSSHFEDVKLLQKSLHEIKKIEGLTIALAGFKNEIAFFQMENIFKKIANYKRIDRLPLDNYMNCYNGAGCSLVPLVNNNFNQHKSNLKLLEAACKKIPAIVSFVPPYSDDRDAPVLWVINKSDWYKRMKALHESEAMREDYGQKLYEWAKSKYNLDYWNKERFELYKTLIA